MFLTLLLVSLISIWQWSAGGLLPTLSWLVCEIGQMQLLLLKMSVVNYEYIARILRLSSIKRVFEQAVENKRMRCWQEPRNYWWHISSLVIQLYETVIWRQFSQEITFQKFGTKQLLESGQGWRSRPARES